jgi:ABC-type dipeptide/oligopeptide/nickel transport system permease subunit
MPLDGAVAAALAQAPRCGGRLHLGGALSAPAAGVATPFAASAWFRRLGDARREVALVDQVALVLFLAVLLGSLVGPLFLRFSPGVPAGDPFQPPGSPNILGTDEVGRDMFTRILYGARTSWISALVVIASGITVGGLVGLAAGAVGGWVDTVLMRLTDTFLALPAPVLAIAVVAVLGPSLPHLVLAVAVVWWPYYARIVRGEIKALAARPHMEAARLAGVSTIRLWTRHLLPGAIPPIIVAASLDVGGLILTLAGLSFLGLGAPQPAPELGAMVARGLPYLLDFWWVPVAPAAAVFLLTVLANLTGDALRDALGADG